MKERLDKILGGHLDGLIPVGDCKETTMVDEKLKQHDVLINALEQNHTRCQTETRGELKILTIGLSELKDEVKELVGVTNKLVAKLSNGINERVDYIESETQTKVSREEFNGAINGFRGTVNTMKWIFGLTFPAVLGALVTLVILSLGGK